MKEMAESKRTLQPDLQEALKEKRVHVSARGNSTFNIADTTPHTEVHRRQKGQAPLLVSSKDNPNIIGTKPDALLRDRAGFETPQTLSRQVKSVRDFQSAVACLPTGSSLSP